MADVQVQEIKEKLSIVEVVGQYTQVRRAGRNFVARCPFHNERTPSFHISPERGTYICFGCGEKGDVFSFVQKIEGIDFKTALEELAKKAGVVLERKTFAPGAKEHEKEVKEKEEVLRDICEAATVYFESVLAQRPDVLKYLEGRHVTPETIKMWRLGYAPANWQSLSDHLSKLGFKKEDIADAGVAAKSDKRPGEIYDRFRGRIMFPMSDAQGRVIAFSGRFFEDIQSSSTRSGDGAGGESEQRSEPAKYVNSPETALFKKSRVLYGFDKAKSAIRKADCMLLVEGQFDLVMAHQSGLPFTVAVSGTALTPEHLTLLGRLSKRLVLALDGDAAGVRAGHKSALMALALGFDVKIPTFQDGKDPADIAGENPELLKEAVRASKTAIEFFLEVLRTDLKGNKKLDERAYKKAVQANVLPLIAVLSSKIDQEHFTRMVASKLLVSEEAVRAEVAHVPRYDPHAFSNSALASAEEHTPAADQLVSAATEQELSAIEKKAVMLLLAFPKDSPDWKDPTGSPVYERLVVLFGQERIDELQKECEPRAEFWRFTFEKELGEHTSVETIAADMLADIARAVERESYKRKYL
ncbi:MAG: DNA primase [bacterium]